MTKYTTHKAWAAVIYAVIAVVGAFVGMDIPFSVETAGIVVAAIAGLWGVVYQVRNRVK